MTLKEYEEYYERAGVIISWYLKPEDVKQVDEARKQRKSTACLELQSVVYPNTSTGANTVRLYSDLEKISEMLYWADEKVSDDKQRQNSFELLDKAKEARMELYGAEMRVVAILEKAQAVLDN